MSTGTTGGLLDSPKATSVFKHEILRQYVTPFLAKVASRSTDHRATLLDGFAGRGRFDNGDPGSAELFLRAVSGRPGINAHVRLFEKDKTSAARLSEVAAEYAARGIDVTVQRADIVDHLEEVVTLADGAPLFMLLDPCGQNVPFDMLVRILTGPRSSKWPPTEVMLNLGADFTRRISGTFEKGRDSAGIETMTRMVGGGWWKDLAVSVHAATADGSWGPAADAVANEYTRLLASATGMGGVLTPVRRKPENQPTYHLAFLTRSPHGHWVMANALALARQVWLREVGPQPDDDQQALFEVDSVGDMIIDEQEAAMTRARVRLRGLAQRERKFMLMDHVIEAYGSDYGLLTESNLGKVMRGLEKEGLLTHEKGNLDRRIYTIKG